MFKRLGILLASIAMLSCVAAPLAYAVLPNIFATQPAGNVAASLLDTNFTFLESQGVQALTTTGSSNAYVATPADAWVTGYSSYVGRALTVKPSFTNTGASTVNVSGLGAASLYKNVSGVQTALSSGDIVSGTPAILICDGTAFLLANPTSSTFSPSQITNSISGNVSLNNVSNFFDGPSIAQGSTGVWFVSGTVTLYDTVGIGTFDAKLWDGTTIIDSSRVISSGANATITIALSGYLSAPAGNLRISARDSNSTSGVMANSVSGLGKDSTITAFRIQ